MEYFRVKENPRNCHAELIPSELGGDWTGHSNSKQFTSKTPEDYEKLSLIQHHFLFLLSKYTELAPLLLSYQHKSANQVTLQQRSWSKSESQHEKNWHIYYFFSDFRLISGWTFFYARWFFFFIKKRAFSISELTAILEWFVFLLHSIKKWNKWQNCTPVFSSLTECKILITIRLLGVFHFLVFILFPNVMPFFKANFFTFSKVTRKSVTSSATHFSKIAYICKSYLLKSKRYLRQI